MTMKIKRSSVAGKVPTTSDLELGQLAMNTNDGKLFMKKVVSGAASVVAIGGAEPQVGDIVFGSSAPANGTWLETGKYYSKSLYPSLASNIGNVPDGGPIPKNSSINAKTSLVLQGSLTYAKNTMATNGAGVYVALGQNAFLYSTNGTDWVQVASNTSATFYSIRYLNGRFIAVGSGTSVTSVNGLDWEPILNTGYVGRDVAYGAGLYVIIADSGRVYYSADLRNWQVNFIGTATTPVYVIYESTNGCFLFTTSNGIYRSTDGINWTQVYSPQGFAIFWDGARFLVGGGSSNIVWSTTGETGTWTSLTVGGGSVIDFAFGGGVYVAATSAAGLLYSVAPTTSWTQAANTSSQASLLWRGVVYDSAKGIFVAAGTKARYYTSPNGSTWTAYSTTRTFDAMTAIHLNGRTYLNGYDQLCEVNADSSHSVVYQAGAAAPSFGLVGTAKSTVAYGNGVYVAIPLDNSGTAQGSLWRSTDGVNWSGVPFVSSGGFAPDRMYFFNGNFFAIGGSNTSAQNMAYSTDGLTWTFSSLSTNVLYSMSYGAGVYVFVGAGGAVYSGASLASLTSRSAGSNQFNDIVFGGGVFVAVGNGSWYSSTDGITWTLRTASYTLHRVIFASGLFVAAGLSGAIASSSDGATVSGRTIGSSQYSSVAFNGTRFVAVAAAGVIAYSTDATASVWGNAYTTNSYGDTSANFAHVWAVGTTFFASSNTNPVLLRSEDGISWEKIATSTGGGCTSMSYENGRLFMLCGGAFQTSTNGVNWTLTNVTPNFATNATRLYKFGPYYYLLSAGGLFYSSDGLTFNRVASVAGMAAVSMAYSGSVWVLVTQAASGRPLTVFKSTNGINFTQSARFVATMFTSTGTSLLAQDIVYAGGKFVLLFNNSNSTHLVFQPVYTSSDAVTWSPTALPYNAIGAGPIATDGSTILLPATNTIMKSTDGGATFAPVLALQNAGNGLIIYVDGVWIFYNTVGRGLFISTDTTTWTMVAEVSDFPFTAVYKSGNYIFTIGQTVAAVIHIPSASMTLIPLRTAGPPPFQIALGSGFTEPAVVRGTTVLVPYTQTSQSITQPVAEVPLYSYDTATTFWVPPFRGGAGQKAFIFAGA